MRWIALIVALGMALIAFALLPLRAQSPPGQKPSFEVVSIKRSSNLNGSAGGGSCQGHDTRGNTIAFPLGQCVFTRVTVKWLIQSAYGLRLLPQQVDEMIGGGPKWANSDQFDIIAKAENPATVTDQQLHEMLQTLLFDRFRLKLHRESKDLVGYTLEATPNSTKINRAADKSGVIPPVFIGDGGVLVFKTTSMDGFARFLSGSLGRPVINKTGLPGDYDFTVSWTPDENEVVVGGPLIGRIAQLNPFGPSIYSALQEQLGLRLKSQRVATQIFVIDAIQPPTEN